MSKIPDDRLARLLDTPLLARVVPHLPPETLHQLIQHRGLDACGELVTAATPAQLTVLLDLDLWNHARPGRDHRFDVDRFGEWLEVLVDTGHAAAARTVAAIDKDLVIAGLSRYVRVFDPGIFEPTAQSDDEAPDPHDAMREGDSLQIGEGPLDESSGDECEIGGYVVRARRSDGWDVIITLLGALESEQEGYFHTVMQGCRDLSNSRPEIDGLDDLLMAPEQHLHEVTIERERRRSQQGYATPADARAFLQMARQPRESRVNPIVTAYFRAADEVPESPDEEVRPPLHRLGSPASQSSDAGGRDSEVPESLEGVIELLTEAGMMPERPRALLEAADADPHAEKLAHLRRLMARVRDTDDVAYFTRSRELAFLANTLLAGCSVQSRALTPQEASDAAAAICNLGLEYWPPPGTVAPESLLVDHDLVSVFDVGWSVLYRDVSLYAADQLVSILSRLADLEYLDRDVRDGLAALRRALVTERDAGTPWRARDAAEILSMLDMTAWIGVLGLLDECPIVPAALMAVVDGRTTSVSPTDFEFISTPLQIEAVRTFVAKLPRLLAG